jgi:hypothetical protein
LVAGRYLRSVTLAIIAPHARVSKRYNEVG